eukprot:scaffold134_cov94-Amphora_coffeaeformis.AAC.17
MKFEVLGVPANGSETSRKSESDEGLVPRNDAIQEHTGSIEQFVFNEAKKEPSLHQVYEPP